MAWGLEAHERIRTSQPGDLVMGWEHQIYIYSFTKLFSFLIPYAEHIENFITSLFGAVTAAV